MLLALFSHDSPPEDPYRYVPFNESFATTALAPQFSTTSVWSIRIHLIPPMGIYHFNGVALLLLPILCLVGLIGNFMVCVAIATDRRLHNVTNYFLFSLALADLLVCCIVMPLSIVVEVRHGVWTWSVSMCLLYVYSDVFLCSASIVHMSVISLDRYLGISQPLRTRNKSKSLIFLKIAIVWAVTLAVSCPIAVLAVIDTTNILQDNQCMIFSRYYIVYGSTMTFLIPFCIMAVTYVKTTSLLKKQASVLSQKADDRLSGNGLRRTMPHRKLGYVRTYSATANPTYANGKALAVHGRTMSSISNMENGDMLSTNRPAINNNGHKPLVKASTINRWRSRTSNYLTNIANKVGRRSSLQAATQDLANEHKATRVLAVVFSCFFICWTPFFAVNFVIGFCGSGCEIPPWLGSVFLWLGYISSTINPIIYTVFNKRFRQAFVRILRCQCCHSFRDSSQQMYSRNYTTTIVPDTYTCSRSNHERTTSVVVRDETRSSRQENHRARSEFSGDNCQGKANGKLTSEKKKDMSLVLGFVTNPSALMVTTTIIEDEDLEEEETDEEISEVCW
uniref:G_PROTEIN_RECEP_F1_2 domain-containing protein n=1 Tax=Caenorhabditis japonica TaxID=281687 RepID=A0A8R1DL45_CAEJA